MKVEKLPLGQIITLLPCNEANNKDEIIFTIQGMKLSDLKNPDIDTIKTRFMASSSDTAAFDWSSMYDGLGSSMLASFPSSAAFMVFYELSQFILTDGQSSPLLGTRKRLGPIFGRRRVTCGTLI